MDSMMSSRLELGMENIESSRAEEESNIVASRLELGMKTDTMSSKPEPGMNSIQRLLPEVAMKNIVLNLKP
jgi:hypothetical protein